MATEAERLKAEGNSCFQAGRFFDAEKCYRQAIAAASSDNPKQLAILYTNLSTAQFRIEKYSEATESASKAIECDASSVKAYVRRGHALAASLDFKGAQADYLAAARLDPANQGVRKLAQSCKDRLYRMNLLKAMSREEEAAPPPPPEADGPLPEFDAEYAREVTLKMKANPANRPAPHVFRGLIHRVNELIRERPNIEVIDGVRGTFRVVGDTHGQFFDFLQIFEKWGEPADDNPYLFNGDYVDRGSLGVEILIVLFAWKIARPEAVFLNRGNHETEAMNTMYGFEGEVKAKYTDKRVASDLRILFMSLQLGHVINHRVFVIHGGLFRDKTTTIESLQALDRHVEPEGNGSLNDLLWADPMEENGFAPSPRGVTSTFGPDVTQNFLALNKLELVIRSHQVQEEGYLEMHGGKCVTVFSAPNYCGQMGNKGAIVRLDFAADGSFGKPEYEQFGALPCPDEYRPMRYCSFMY
jgi:serine/threonine-protein phosphatase 5